MSIYGTELLADIVEHRANLPEIFADYLNLNDRLRLLTSGILYWLIARSETA
jgi:hypothetical protein